MRVLLKRMRVLLKRTRILLKRTRVLFERTQVLSKELAFFFNLKKERNILFCVLFYGEKRTKMFFLNF